MRSLSRLSTPHTIWNKEYAFHTVQLHMHGCPPCIYLNYLCNSRTVITDYISSLSIKKPFIFRNYHRKHLFFDLMQYNIFRLIYIFFAVKVKRSDSNISVEIKPLNLLSNFGYLYLLSFIIALCWFTNKNFYYFSKNNDYRKHNFH